MKFVDLKRSKKEIKEEISVSEEGPDYPWGTRMHLGDDELQKMGNPTAAVGEEFEFMAKARVRSISEHSDENRNERSMSIQITHIAMEEEEKSDADTAKKLFE